MATVEMEFAFFNTMHKGAIMTMNHNYLKSLLAPPPCKTLSLSEEGVNTPSFYKEGVL